MENDLPDYDALPLIERIGMRHAWDVFGRDDQLGTINLLTPDRVLAAIKTVERGETINLSLPLTEPDPPLYGRRRLQHEVFSIDRNNLDDRMDSFYPQASSQWDGLRHVRAREFGYYGGMTETPEAGGGHLGIERWAEHGMFGRGVLLDIAGYFEGLGEPLDPLEPRPITADDLRATAAGQNVRIETGDILCLHFGWIEGYRAMDHPGRERYAHAPSFPGLEGSEAMARLLWNWHVAALACDNPAVEMMPGDPQVGSLHRRILPLLGFCLGEMLDFSRLTTELRAAGRWTFMFGAVPLNLPGGVGSPANAIAIL
ncbi:MAG: hypothetical protein TEF_18840 [Rhizobiales bacterium NRL2]|jgi:hypothetical protein|nr:MAG: hypothetical protein TEF_18840 [Rhizobiales bacterium NRL2]